MINFMLQEHDSFDVMSIYVTSTELPCGFMPHSTCRSVTWRQARQCLFRASCSMSPVTLLKASLALFLNTHVHQGKQRETKARGALCLACSVLCFCSLWSAAHSRYRRQTSAALKQQRCSWLGPTPSFCFCLAGS